MSKIEQGSIVIMNFDPSSGSEINKRRPALVISRDEYNYASDLIIVCPITSTGKKRPYFLPIKHKALTSSSKVNVKQVYSLDASSAAGRKVEVVGKISKKELLWIAQHFLLNFNFNL